MKVKIEDYRGFEISFDTDKEVFYMFSDAWDTENTAKSYAAIKKRVDDYIKENYEFKPFFITTKSLSYLKELQVVSLRKDGRFNVKSSNGDVVVLSDYSIKDYYEKTSDNKELIEKYNELESKIQNMIQEQRKLSEQFVVGRPLYEIQQEHKQNLQVK